MERDVCDEFVRLRYNPLQIFKASKTPAGFYTRQKWLMNRIFLVVHALKNKRCL